MLQLFQQMIAIKKKEQKAKESLDCVYTALKSSFIFLM
jgi:hypothetical protein